MPDPHVDTVGVPAVHLCGIAWIVLIGKTPLAMTAAANGLEEVVGMA
jgi:hypothetical protein